MENNTTDLAKSEEVVQEKIKGMRAMVAETEVKDDATFAAVSDKIQAIKQIGLFIRSEMEKYTKPAREIIKNAQSKYLPFEKECQEAERALKDKAGAYYAAQEAERRRKEAIIEKQLEAGRLKETTAIRKLEAIGEQKKSVRGNSSQLTARTVRVAEIVDVNQIPDEYWIIDEARVKRAALAGAVIPGVIIREETDFSSRK